MIEVIMMVFGDPNCHYLTVISIEAAISGP